MAIGQPSSISPDTFATGTCTLEKKTSLKPASPVTCLSGRRRQQVDQQRASAPEILLDLKVQDGADLLQP